MRADDQKKTRVSWVGILALLGTVLLIALLALSWGDYSHRAQAAEAVSLLGAAKAPLAEYFDNHRRWPLTLEGLVDSTSGHYTRSVTISKGGGGSEAIELTAQMARQGVDRRVAGHTVRLFSTDGGQNWTCRPGTMPADNLPQPCRD